MTRDGHLDPPGHVSLTRDREDIGWVHAQPGGHSLGQRGASIGKWPRQMSSRVSETRTRWKNL
jgi:hypothetical protein